MSLQASIDPIYTVGDTIKPGDTLLPGEYILNGSSTTQISYTNERDKERMKQAGIALQGLMHHMEFRLLSNEELAEKAFDIAEAMIKEAEKRGMKFY